MEIRTLPNNNTDKPIVNIGNIQNEVIGKLGEITISKTNTKVLELITKKQDLLGNIKDTKELISKMSINLKERKKQHTRLLLITRILNIIGSLMEEGVLRGGFLTRVKTSIETDLAKKSISHLEMLYEDLLVFKEDK